MALNVPIVFGPLGGPIPTFDLDKNFTVLAQTYVSSIAELRTVPKSGSGVAVAQGYYAQGDGGGGLYFYNAADTSSADNGGAIIVAADGGRWYLANTTSVSVQQFGAKGIGASFDDTAAIQAAITWGLANGHQVLVPQTAAYYNTSSTLDIGDAYKSYAGLQFTGVGLPTIQCSNLTVPIISIGGERLEVSGMSLGFSSPPTVGQTNAAAFMIYNLYESRLVRLRIFNVNNAVVQAQSGVNISGTPTTAGGFTVGVPYKIASIGTTDFTAIGASSNTVGVNFVATGVGTGTGTAYAGSQNTYYSNFASDWRIVGWSNFAIDLIPFGGGNSGNSWNNIYCTNNFGTAAGGLNLQVSSDSVFNQFNMEHCTLATAVTLNGCNSIVFNALHFEGLSLSANYQPLVDVYNTQAVFNAVTLAYNIWTPTSPNYLFRASAADGSTIILNGLASYNNTTPANMNFASVSYGCYIYAQGIRDSDGSVSLGVNTPKANISGPLAVTAGSFVPEIFYTILSIGTTDFTLIGAASNTVGLSFTATGAGTGTGTAKIGGDYPIAQFNRASGVLRNHEGANQKQGVATLVAGTVTVANTSVTATSRILTTRQPGGANPGAAGVSAITPNTSFTITSGPVNRLKVLPPSTVL